MATDGKGISEPTLLRVRCEIAELLRQGMPLGVAVWGVDPDAPEALVVIAATPEVALAVQRALEREFEGLAGQLRERG